MDASIGMLHKQARVLRAIQLVASSGLVEDSRGLKESCLVVCNVFRECVPLRYLKVDPKGPSTRLTVFWPGFLSTGDTCVSRVLPPRAALRVDWTFHVSATTHPVVVEKVEKQEAEGEKEEEKEAKAAKAQEENKEREEEEGKEGGEKIVERGQATVSNTDISKVRWPEGVREIFLRRFNQPVDGVVWPDCLEVLSFHMPSRLLGWDMLELRTRGIFNRPLNGVSFPAGLREIFLGCQFNQRIDGVAWPKGLERLSLPGFNHPIHDVRWPPALKALEFSPPGDFERREFLPNECCEQHIGIFDQPLGTFLPNTLRILHISDAFNQSLRGVSWPSGLVVLGLGTGITAQSVDGVEWPPKLQKLFVSDTFYGIEDAPPGCRPIYFGRCGIPDSNPGAFDIDELNDVDY